MTEAQGSARSSGPRDATRPASSTTATAAVCAPQPSTASSTAASKGRPERGITASPDGADHLHPTEPQSAGDGTPMMLNPPSTWITSPVTADERSEPRYTAVLPQSSMVMCERRGATWSKGP